MVPSYPKTGLPDLLGVPADRIDDNRLYRALDELLPHKETLGIHLKNRIGELFNIGPITPSRVVSPKRNTNKMIFRAMPEKIPGFGVGPKEHRASWNVVLVKWCLRKPKFTGRSPRCIFLFVDFDFCKR